MLLQDTTQTAIDLAIDLKNCHRLDLSNQIILLIQTTIERNFLVSYKGLGWTLLVSTWIRILIEHTEKTDADMISVRQTCSPYAKCIKKNHTYTAIKPSTCNPYDQQRIYHFLKTGLWWKKHYTYKTRK